MSSSLARFFLAAAPALCAIVVVLPGVVDANEVEQHAAFEVVKPGGTTHGLEKLHELIERNRGEVINARDKHDHTPLNMAAYWGNPEAAKVLLAAGANPSNPDVNGHTPLHHAVLSRTNTAEQAEALIGSIAKGGGDLEATDNRGCTPLDSAFVQRQRGVASADAAIRALVAAGAEDHHAEMNRMAPAWGGGGKGGKGKGKRKRGGGGGPQCPGKRYGSDTPHAFVPAAVVSSSSS